jgi:hypothetical protein
MRRFLVFVLALSLPFSALTAPAPQSYERQEQEEAVAAIRRLGGKVLYDYQRPNPGRPNVFDPNAAPKDPKGFHSVVMVDLRGTKASDDDLKCIRKLPDLENLDLTDTRITGAGLAQLRGLKKLAVLGLWKTQVDDEGLKYLSSSANLWQLVLDETKVTDSGLAQLENLTNLEEWLGLTDTRVTDEGLKHLERLTKLRSLNLRRTRVTAAGVAKLRTALPNTAISFDP